MIYNLFLPLVISLLGLALGYLFAFLAPEEVKPGEKYFRWMKRILLIVFLGVVVYGLIKEWLMMNGLMMDGLIMSWTLLLLAALIIMGLIIIGLDFTMKSITKPITKLTTKQVPPGALELATYVYFVLVYFLLPSQQLLLASLIFLYGLPAGTLRGKGKN